MEIKDGDSELIKKIEENFVNSEPPEVKVEQSDVAQCKRIKLEVDVMDWLDEVVVANEPAVHSNPKSISKRDREIYG